MQYKMYNNKHHDGDTCLHIVIRRGAWLAVLGISDPRKLIIIFIYLP